MKTFKQFQNELNLKSDPYTHQIQLNETQFENLLKKAYLIGKIEGIEFGSVWNENSTRPDDEIKSLTAIFKFIDNGFEV